MSQAFRFLAALVVGVAVASSAHAQTPPPQAQTAAAATADATPHPNAFKVIASDYKHFFSADTAKVLGMMSVATIAAVPWDREKVKVGKIEAPTFYKAGNFTGSFLVQVGAGAAAWGAGELLDKPGLADTGWDIIRAQALSQGIVQVLKSVVRRERPDQSNHSSFPSGHSASAFATAGVLHRHYGWKAGVPAYAYGVYVASARMSANKHHISDVVMGAGIGLASARTVTVDVAGRTFGVGVTPTTGGAALNFTMRPH